MQYPSRLRKIGIREFLFGDFDKDNVRNIDDPRPFDPRVKDYPRQGKNNPFYHKAQYGGGEIKLSSVLLGIERRNNDSVGALRHFLKNHPGSSARIKTVPSTIQKLETRYGNTITDRGGGKILTKDRAEATREKDRVQREFRTDPKLYDDYYAKPKGSHYGYHIGAIGKNNSRFEVQLQSKKFSEVDARGHEVYKRTGQSAPMLVNYARKLFKQGYW